VIAGWLVKLIVGIASVGFLAVEAGTPIIVRAQLDGLAHEAADEAGAVLRDRAGNQEAAEETAATIAAKDQATVEEFAVDDQGRARVTLRKEAKSYLLKKWSRLESWYDVRVSATSEGRR
jgi:Flp pilus assembly protein TadG